MYFTFKSTTSTDKGIVLQSMDWFKKPQRRNEQTYVDGKDGATTTEYGYAPFAIPASIGLTDMTKLDEVIALLDGTGVLTFSGDPGKYRNAKVLEQVDYQKLLKFKVADVQFFIEDPYRYVSSESVQTIVSTPATIVNSGTAIALPLLKVVGAGIVELTLNGISMTYEYPSGESYFHLDCATMDTYYDVPTALRNRSITMSPIDTIPVLNVGNNTLTLDSGSITSVEVTKRTRYL